MSKAEKNHRNRNRKEEFQSKTGGGLQGVEKTLDRIDI
jgi:hypothetical protein